MRTGESSAEIRKRVEAARERQRVRFTGTDIPFNADLAGSEAITQVQRVKALQYRPKLMLE